MQSVDETTLCQWADRHECRDKLPVLIRRLVRETTPSLSALRFPGHEAVDLPGLDGEVEADAPSTWVPVGHSIWEIGCNQNPGSKATADYQKRTEKIPEADRLSSTFVFVTPRRWNTKRQWIKERKKDGQWADVRVYDAVDLETWLEEAPVSSRWLREVLGHLEPGICTPHEWWKRWASVSEFPMTTRLVATRRNEDGKDLLEKFRSGQPVITVQADDRGEAVAFVIASLVEADAEDLLDRLLVVSAGAVKIPSTRNSKPIVLADMPDEQDLDYGDRNQLTIVRAYPRGRPGVQGAIVLSHVPSSVFRSELEAMGFSEAEAESKALKTGHSVQVLRRSLSQDPAVNRPVWSRSRSAAKRMIPFALAGAWVEDGNCGDQTILDLLGDVDSCTTRQNRHELLSLDDSPLAKYGNVTVAVSQLDALFAVGPYIEADELERFFELVLEVLGHRDPALDLPPEKRWMANVLGKSRQYSGALMSGIGDALCILAVHGREICGHALQIDFDFQAERIVRQLMQGAEEEEWLSIRGILRTLAEASPSAFLDSLEKDLQRKEPAVQAIMGVAGDGIGGECLRTNLLWALEILAWHPLYFSRVAGITFALQRFPTDDNWADKPSALAKSLFMVQLPATTTGLSDKMTVLRSYSVQFRRPVFEVCISLLPDNWPGLAMRTLVPRWREVMQAVPEPTDGHIREAAVQASRLLLDLSPFDRDEIERLVEISPRLHPEDLARLIGEVDNWGSMASDEDKAYVRHALRRQEAFRVYQRDSDQDDIDLAIREMEQILEPESAKARNQWLFAESYIEWRELLKEENEQEISYEEREARVRAKRAQAIREIQDEVGNDGLLGFVFEVKQPQLVAEVLVTPETPPEEAAEWIKKALDRGLIEATTSFVRQILATFETAKLEEITTTLKWWGCLDGTQSITQFAQLLPGNMHGWTTAAALGPDGDRAYWSRVSPRVWNDTPDEVVEFLIGKLLEVGRPRTAFASFQYRPTRVHPETWEKILKGIAKGDEPAAPVPDSYHLSEVLSCLDDADGFHDERIMALEMPFALLLCSYGHRSAKRALAVHRELARNPELFVQLLSWCYQVPDDQSDEEQRKALGKIAYYTLDAWNMVPGADENGNIDPETFTTWVKGALRIAADENLGRFAELHLGALLARYARHRRWEDWLPEPLLNILDSPENDGLRDKFELGIRNSRGITSRSPFDGGAQERKLAARYRTLASNYVTTHPRVAGMLLSVAESYEWDAKRHDNDAVLGERWQQ
ncbi:hypothetical protein [Marinobacter sp. HN1S83]|uniref:hypothetical protein n=1 Tax=Marinobacter sp. HN1S83 TaxID=3382301 RepID=UPI00387B253E